MSWIDEIGESKWEDEDINKAAKVLLLLAALEEEDSSEFKDVLTGVVDTGIYNLQKLKEALENN